MNKTKLSKLLLPILTAALFAPLSAQAAEQPSFGATPKGFKTGYRAQQGGITLIELVPQKQTVHDWTQMVTLQTFLGDTNSAAGFRDDLSVRWQNACPQSSFNPISEGRENGYPFTLFQMTCRHNPQTGKPEHTWIKAIQGDDGLYVKQYAIRYAPNRAEQNTAVENLRGLSLCNNTPQHPCRAKGKR